MWEEGDVGVWHKKRLAEFEAARPGVKVQPTQIPSTNFENTIQTQNRRRRSAGPCCRC